MAACVIAITPKMLVSNTSRVVVMSVASNAPTTPTPALFTSTSIGPAASIAPSVLSGVSHVEISDRINNDEASLKV